MTEQETWLTRKNRAYQVVPYDPSWPQQYDSLKQRLEAILGDEILQIEHAGSTAVPGLSAKPQIDIYIQVRSLPRVRQLKAQMEQGGFTAKGDYVGHGEEYFVEDDATGKRKASIHVVEQGNPAFEPHVLFRDYLRAHDEERDRYDNLKQELVKKFPDDYNAYGEGKRQPLEEMKERARKWAASTSKS